MSEWERELKFLAEDIRRRRRDIRAPQPIADVVSRLMSRRGYAQSRSADAVHEAWKEAAGEFFAARSRPGNVGRGVLEIFAQNAIAHQELVFQAKPLLRRMQELLPEHGIRDLRFRVGAVN